MEIKRRFQKFCQKYQKLNFTTTKKCNFFKDHTSGTSDAPTVHLGHLSQNSRCPRPPRDTCPLPLLGLVDRCGDLDTEPTWSWYDILSPGEQQRLAFAR